MDSTIFDTIAEDCRKAESLIRALPAKKRKQVREAIRLRRKIARIEREQITPLKAELSKREDTLLFQEMMLAERQALMKDYLQTRERALQYQEALRLVRKEAK